VVSTLFEYSIHPKHTPTFFVLSHGTLRQARSRRRPVTLAGAAGEAADDGVETALWSSSGLAIGLGIAHEILLGFHTSGNPTLSVTS